MTHSKLWWSFVQIRRNRAFRRNIVAQIWRRWASRSRSSWWRRGKIFWWDRRCCRSWNFRSSKWLWAWFCPQFHLLWLLFDRLKFNRDFLSRALLKNRKRDGESTFCFVWVFIFVAKPPAFVHRFPQRVQTNWNIGKASHKKNRGVKEIETSVSFHITHKFIQNMNSGMSTQ